MTGTEYTTHWDSNGNATITESPTYGYQTQTSTETVSDVHYVWQGCHLTAALTGLATIKNKETLNVPLTLAGSDVDNKEGECDH